MAAINGKIPVIKGPTSLIIRNTVEGANKVWEVH